MVVTQVFRFLRRARWAVVAALVTAVAAGAQAQGEDPLIVIDLQTTGPQSHLGDWVQGALRDEQVRVRWPLLEEGGRFEGEPACVLTWSDPDRSPAGTKRLRQHLRDGGGLIYVVGEGNPNIRTSRDFLGPVDVDVRGLDAGAGAAEWVAHPLTEGSPDLGAVNAGSAISGTGANPLIRSGGREIAAAFDWGPMGRAVILDHSVLFDQLNETRPRPAVRDFLVRSMLWAARAGEETADTPPPVERPEIPSIEDLIGQQAAPPIAHRNAVVDLPDDNKNNWAAIRTLLLAELDRADLEINAPKPREDEALFDSDTLERAGLAVIGTWREADDVDWSEPLALGWFFNRGGRILAIPHAAGGTMGRMVGFNEMLTQLRIAVSLERGNGRAQFVEHPITEGIRTPEDGLGMRGGARVWAPLTEPLVTVRNQPAAVAWQRGEGRIVVIDGQLLLSQGGEDEPYPEMVTLLRNSIEWLEGEL